jgi:hypothetical protein
MGLAAGANLVLLLACSPIVYPFSSQSDRSSKEPGAGRRRKEGMV